MKIIRQPIKEKLKSNTENQAFTLLTKRIVLIFEKSKYCMGCKGSEVQIFSPRQTDFQGVMQIFTSSFKMDLQTFCITF